MADHLSTSAISARAKGVQGVRSMPGPAADALLVSGSSSQLPALRCRARHRLLNSPALTRHTLRMVKEIRGRVRASWLPSTIPTTCWFTQSAATRHPVSCSRVARVRLWPRAVGPARACGHRFYAVEVVRVRRAFKLEQAARHQQDAAGPLCRTCARLPRSAGCSLAPPRAPGAVEHTSSGLAVQGHGARSLQAQDACTRVVDGPVLVPSNALACRCARVGSSPLAGARRAHGAHPARIGWPARGWPRHQSLPGRQPGPQPAAASCTAWPGQGRQAGQPACACSRTSAGRSGSGRRSW